MKALFRILVILGCFFAMVITIFVVTHRDRRPRIYFAAETGDTNAIGHFLAQGTNVNAPVVCYLYGGRTAPLLHIAAGHEKLEAVEFLLRHGADPNLLDSSGYTPLHCVIGRGENPVAVGIVQTLLKAGADPNLRSSSGFWTPLIHAADLGESEMVRVLLAARADIQATNSDGLTAIHYAENGEIATLLINAGADPTARLGGETPAESATRLGNFSALAVFTNAAAQTKRETRP